jgi:hypothetical protein
MAELDLSSTRATLDPWYNQQMNTTYCSSNIQFYVRDAAFSPDESRIYIAATGKSGSSPYCDAVTAFTNTPDSSVIWTNATGGDSLYSIAANDTDVYVAGHQRWLDNPQGNNSCLTTCVSRPGVADVDATTGLATDWNPTRDRGLGADDLLLTPNGLWIAADTTNNAVRCGHVYHPGICFFPGQ